uniref:Golgin subfamily A conserved domain-containing protein n=1 Tax=Molossus molossus TaxID=27622 RepID=A0A7J8EF73_MOLMO|nr:hypothetical protein HJG59_008820 [Molossus molossus]
MSEEVRQKKLAEARKKLREFQQQRGISVPSGAKKKKKIKNGSSPETATSDGHSPEDIQDILKVLVSDLSHSNGVALSPLDNWKAPKDHTAPAARPSDDTMSPAGVLSPSATSSTQNYDPENVPFVLSESTFSSTESLRQLSQQLNGLVCESASFVNGEGLASSANIKALESRYQELSLALDSSNLTNKQLSSEIEELKRQNQEIVDQLEKEKQEYKQKLAKEQGALREQLQIHIQTIGILVSEKTELQTALAHTQQAARQKTGEAEDLAGLLQSSQQRVGDLERTLCAVSTQQKQADRYNKELTKNRDALKLELYKNNKTNEDLKQENSELQEKLRVLVTDKEVLQLRMDELQKKLEMSELLLQQFSSQSETPDSKEQLQQALEERAQLETRVEQLKDLLKQLQVERDQYAENLKEENAIWQQKMQQMSEQMCKLREEKEHSVSQVQELETSLAELSFMALPGEGGGLDEEEETEEEAPRPQLSMPEDLDSREAMVAFFNTALASAEEEQSRLRKELKKQKLRCQCLARLAAPSQHKLEEESPALGTGGHSVPAETHQALQVAMDKLQSRFTELMQENVDLKERVEELEHRCIQLSGETDTIGDYITLYQNQRAVLKERHREKEEYISRLAKDKEDMKVKLLELQELVVRLVSERNELYGKFLGAAQSPAGESTPALPAPQATGAAHSQGDLQEVSLADSAEPDPAALENSTAQQIMQLLCELQSPQEYAGLSKNPCIPFFYRADDNTGVKIMVI